MKTKYMILNWILYKEGKNTTKDITGSFDKTRNQMVDKIKVLYQYQIYSKLMIVL